MNHTYGYIPHILSMRLILFLIFSSILHGLILLTWEEPLQFDFGGQQLNQQTLQIALRSPTPKPVEEKQTEPAPPMEEVVVKPEEPEVVEEAAAPQPEPALQPEPEVIQQIAPPTPQPITSKPEPKSKPEPVTAKPQKQHVPFQQKRIERPVAKTKTVTPEKLAKPTPVAPLPAQPEPAPKHAPSREAATEKETPIHESEATQQSIAMIRRLIQGELGRHFQYPRQARRRGWEGKVHLEFTVQPNGKITGIRILNGSKHGILNRSAVKTMTRIHQLNQISEGMLQGPVRMEIPIIYQLSNR